MRNIHCNASWECQQMWLTFVRSVLAIMSNCFVPWTWLASARENGLLRERSVEEFARIMGYTEEDLEAARADYTSGEVIAPGLLHCVHCESTTTLTRPSVLEPCHACGHRFFSRGAPPVTRQPPAADESDQG